MISLDDAALAEDEVHARTYSVNSCRLPRQNKTILSTVSCRGLLDEGWQWPLRGVSEVSRLNQPQHMTHFGSVFSSCTKAPKCKSVETGRNGERERQRERGGRDGRNLGVDTSEERLFALVGYSRRRIRSYSYQGISICKTMTK